MDEQITSISVLAELDRCGIKYKFASENEVKIHCPFHDDKNPSCSVNVQKCNFRCHTAGCKAKGDIVTLLAKILKTTRRVMWEDLSTRYSLENVKIIDTSAVERWHTAIWAAKPFLQELYKRGMTEELIRKYRIGYDNSRITIPIPNENFLIVNIRRYLPGAPGPEKMMNKRGHGRLRLFPLEQLKYKTIVVCGGEIKAIVTADRLNKFGIGAVTATSGEGNWHPSFNAMLKDKTVYVCFDIDSEGEKASRMVCARIKKDVKFLGNIVLPLDKDRYPKGDVNDYFGIEGKTGEDLLKVIAQTPEWNMTSHFDLIDDSSVTSLQLSEASQATHTGKRIKLRATIAAMDIAPYVIPKKLNVLCDRNQENCGICPVYAQNPDKDGIITLELSPESPAILDMVAVSKKFQRDAIIAGLRMPRCKTVEFTTKEFFNVEDIRLSPQLEISSRAEDDILQPALYVGHGLETNENYEFVGRMYPHPKNQQSVILISESKTTEDALSNYVPSEKALKQLRVFQPKEWTVDSITEKLREIYDDLSANITHIFERQDLHFIIDLAYHSVLLFNFDEKLTKGWVETLIEGDSSQGKTDTVSRLMIHYGLGEKIPCKNATVAGLMGGLQQLGSRWFVTWGIIPMHDKRLVVLEELKGTSTDVIGKLTEMRSSGVAEISKIEKRRTHARTRLIMISNPRSDLPLSSYNFGIEAIKELIGGLEDVRRFDAVLLTSAKEIPVDVLNKLQQYRPKIKHKFNSKRCRSLILWAWTRTPEQVLFDSEAINTILSEATRLCSIFTETIPIVDRGSMRFKLCRLAISLACRTFSYHEDSVLVRRCHVEYISKFLERIYSTDIFGYRDFSEAIKASNTLLNVDILAKRILQTPFPYDFVKQMLHTNEIEFRDIADWCSWEKGETSQLLSLLVRKHALLRDGRGYRKTPKFIEFLKQLLLSEDMKTCNRPDYIEEEF